MWDELVNNHVQNTQMVLKLKDDHANKMEKNWQEQTEILNHRTQMRNLQKLFNSEADMDKQWANNMYKQHWKDLKSTQKQEFNKALNVKTA